MYETTDYNESIYIELETGVQPEMIKKNNQGVFQFPDECKTHGQNFFKNEGRFLRFTEIGRTRRSQLNFLFKK